MIRNPLQSAFSRTKPDAARVADGISNSLRSFSIAARLAAEENSGGNSSGRSRATGAVDSLIQKAESSVKNLRRSAPGTATASRGGPNIIRVTTLPGRGRGGARGGFSGQRTSQQGGQGGGRAAPIDGLTLSLTGAREPRQFTPRGPGTFDRRGGGGGGGGSFRGRGSGGFDRDAREDRGGRGRGRGGRGDRRDRGGRESVDGREGEGESQEDWGPNQLDPLFVTKEEALYIKTLEEGVEHTFDPTFNLESLHGFAPAIATSKSPFAYAATAITQARVLGGGRPYSENERMMPEDAAKEYTKGTGMFFSDPEARAWAQQHSGLEIKDAPDETKQAVLDAALLGKYDAPKAVKLGDTLAMVQNYMKKDTRAYGQPGRDVHDKVKSLLPGQAPTTADGKKDDQKPKAK